ncbi:exonuclease domain-containing protein [Croceitalea rosinachiae]|uniref:Exonuclease domain-containing protein n=1 Tax=Croceitalea rosinachiae TaxID=3075596 RepID=A0ABU3ACU2_9FLAO|nr:exonuclease domain-containing protein [Croceitalea sp. F388]MDT0608002.1 exonuclease domain-containing protein [Croceitalea sp. F388]
MYTIIDIETTGNGIKGNKITEISIFKFDGEQIIDEFTSLVNPECEIPYFITGLTGIDNQLVANAPTFKELANNILEITKDCIFIAHSVNFDYGIIKEEFRQLELDFSRKKLCTIRLSRKLIPGLKSYSLGKLCTSLSIPLTDRHRARGDAHATLLLFQILLKKSESSSIIKTFLNARSQEATLPPLLSKSIVNNLPTTPGVYYFKDKNGKIIYIGKAVNIKKRVLGHFYDKSNHEIRLCKEIADIDFELSGSELLALLMESAAIKEHYPMYNRAQKKTVKQYAIFSYEDRKGVLHLAFDSLRAAPNPLMIFYNQVNCRTYLENLCEALFLCPKYCHLQTAPGPCSHFRAKSCEGICRSEESPLDYNNKVYKAIAILKKYEDRVLIERNGRNPDEKAIILLENGVYKGYGFIENNRQVNSEEDLKAIIIPQKNTVEAQRIIQSSIKRKFAITR